MSRNELRGVDLTNNQLWQCREITEEGGQTVWIGTGRDISGIVLHLTVKDALVYYMMAHPETDTIQGVIADQYRISVPSQAAAKSILDVILEDLRLKEPEQETLL